MCCFRLFYEWVGIMKSATFSKPEQVVRCLQAHRKLIRTPNNPYSKKPKVLNAVQQENLLTSCQALFVHSCECTSNFKQSFNSISTSLSRIISSELQNPVHELITQMAVFACEKHIREMVFQIFGNCERILKWLQKNKGDTLRSIMERTKVQVLIRFWRKNDLYFLEKWGDLCFRIFKEYLTGENGRVLKSRHTQICSEFGKVVGFYLKSKSKKSQGSAKLSIKQNIRENSGRQTSKQRSIRYAFLQEVRQSIVYKHLPSVVRILISQSLEWIKASSNKRQVSISSRHSRISKQSRHSRSSYSSKKQQTAVLSSFRHSSQRSSLILKMAQAQKRFSCQPDMFRSQDFRNIVTNFTKQRNSNIKQEESQPMSSERSGSSLEIDDWDTQQQTERMVSSKTPEPLLQSTKQLVFSGFFQFVRVNGIIQPLIVQNIHLSHDDTVIHFKIRCSKVNSVHFLKNGETIKTKKKSQDINEIIVQKIVKALNLSRAHVGYRIQLNTGTAKTMSRLTFNTNDEIGWVTINGSFNAYYFQQYIFNPQNRNYVKVVFDKTMSEVLQTTTCVKIPTMQKGYARLAPFQMDNGVLNPWFESIDMSLYNSSCFETLNCSSRLTRVFRLNSVKPSQIPSLKSKHPTLTVAQRLTHHQYLDSVKEQFGIHIKQGEKTTVLIDGVACTATLEGFSNSKMRFVVEKEKTKTRKYILLLDKQEMRRMLERYPYAPKYQFQNMSRIIRRFHFKQTTTYPKLSLAEDKQVVIDKFVRKIGATYLIVYFTFLKQFDKISLRIYVPEQRITLECDIIPEDILGEQQRFALELFTLEQMAQVPLLVQQFKSRLQFYTENNDLRIKVFGKVIPYKILVAVRTVTREKRQYHQSFYLSQRFISSPSGSLLNKKVQLRQLCFSYQTKDCILMILLSEAFANYYTTHLNHLLNPIKPEPMSSDLYRFCMGDLITVCKEFEPQKKVPEKKRSYFFVHHSLHMLEYNRKEVQVQRLYPTQKVCKLKEAQVTNKIPFFGEVIKMTGHKIRKRIQQSLNVAYPALYLRRW